MKKTYKLITAFIVLLSLVTLKMGAQLSGVVTIDATAPASATNFTTFTSLASVLNALGISGPLTVNVVTGTGPYVEQVNFTSAPGVSATNTITINGNGNTITFASTNFAAAWTIGLQSADRMNFNNLNVIGTGSNAYPAMLSAGADYNSFTACTFSVNANLTSTSLIPVVISALNTSYSSFGISGSYNTFTGCTMLNGFHGISIYGPFSAPFITNNTIRNCTIQDFHQAGVYATYGSFLTIKNNIIERPLRTISTTCYGIYSWYQASSVIEQNRIQKLFDAMLMSTNQCFGISAYWNVISGGTNRNVVRNNVISDIKHNGTIYGIYALYLDGFVYHNTISLDYTPSTSTSLTYGLFSYGLNGYDMTLRNNLVSISRGGTGTKYGAYFISGNLSSNNNNIYMNAAAGTNYTGYFSALPTNTTLAAFQALGTDANSSSIDPVFTNIATNNLIPTSATLNNTGVPVGVATDIAALLRSGTTPDIGAHEFLSANCAAVPTASSLITPTFALCPGEQANLQISNYTSDLGVTYQWVTSNLSAVGPWTVVPGANSVQYLTPGIFATTYYGISMTCSNALGSNTVSGILNVAGTTTNSVPYLENFDLVPFPNKLPNCSWSAPNLGSSALVNTTSNTLGRTPRSGSNFAVFFYLPVGANYFYTNGIALEAGITYSASVWYQTEYFGYNNFSDLSILYGTTQTPTGLVPIASTNGPAVSNVYKSLSNTFTVATTGLYYIAVRATAGSGSAQFLVWDDLAITAPCSVNSPTVVLGASNTSVCAGAQIVLTASGADTYTWNTGATTNIITETAGAFTNYYVMGSSSLSGCTSIVSQMITINPSPTVLVYATNPTVCAGQSTMLNALGAASASSYTWSTNANGSSISVSPAVPTTYTVLASNSFGCIGMASQAIAVNALPTIGVASSQANTMCAGETQVLTATGGVTYMWIVSGTGAVMQGSPININPTSTTVYTVTGTNANGCANKATITQDVSECTGLTKNKLSSANIYPNPTSGEVTIELNNTSEKTITVMDVTGRMISSSTSALEVVQVNLSSLSNGVYYVKIQSSTSIEVVKVVKQ